MRLWFPDAEIESLALDELARAQLVPAANANSLAVDIERFVERYLCARLDRSADLPEDVLGVTHFLPGSKLHVEINRDLSDSALDDEYADVGEVGRFRATVAHEAAHILLHRTLYELDDMDRGLFPRESEITDQKRHRCLKRSGLSDWREVQANKGMAALLMPRPVFGPVARSVLATLGDPTATLTATSPDLAAIVLDLAQRFQVSRQAARIRLETLGILVCGAQGTFSI